MVSKRFFPTLNTNVSSERRYLASKWWKYTIDAADLRFVQLRKKLIWRTIDLRKWYSVTDPDMGYAGTTRR